MYASHFRLQREPFSIAPDPRFLYMSEAHREALAHLLYGVSGGGGFVLLTGEIGAGKTTVCRCFLDQVPPNCNVAYIFNPKLGVGELLQAVCEEFHIPLPERATTIKEKVDALNAFLLKSHAAGRNSVLIIDEAQSLSAEVLEQLRLLTNLETAERKLLQIILIGQPELRTMLARPDLEQLAQRVIARYHLPALSERETALYVRHRLGVAGLAGELPFDAAALKLVHRLCRGVPRRINLLADRALLGAYASGQPRVDARIVEKAAREVFDLERERPTAAATARAPRRSVPGWALAAGAVLVLAGAAAAAKLAYDARQPRARMAAAASAALARAPASAASVGRPASGAAVASASAAAAASAPPPPAIATLDNAAALLAMSLPDEARGVQELSAAWGEGAAEADLCDPAVRPGQAARRPLQCLRATVGLAQLRDLGRPALLALRGEGGPVTYVLLTGLDDKTALVQAAGERRRVSIWVLATVWRGDALTLWKAPPGWREPLGETLPRELAAWLDQRLPGPAEQPLKTRITEFQVTHGLKPDGLAGPMTLMQLNRATGVEEPALAR